MNNLIITADWFPTGLPQADFNWVRDYHVKPQVIEACWLINWVLRYRGLTTIPGNGWDTYNGTLRVHLHAGPWNGNNGYYGHNGWKGWTSTGLNILLECSWPDQYAGDTILQHEGVHAFAFTMDIPEFNDLGHGNANDPVIQIEKEINDRMYRTRRNSLSDVYLCHANNPGVRL